eukprot:m.56958 g.56958  ORF g.56958 m.56958 type:complete len:631 (-) comp15758_c0_seq4:62-1954(-)
MNQFSAGCWVSEIKNVFQTPDFFLAMGDSYRAKPAAAGAAASSAKAPATSTNGAAKPATGAAAKDSAGKKRHGVDLSTLNVLLLDSPKSDREMGRVCEYNDAHVQIGSAKGPGTVDARIAVLSWRWDVRKPATQEECKDIFSPKVEKFVNVARKQGFKWAWVDFATVPQYSKDKNELMNHVKGSRILYEEASVLLVDTVEVYPGLSIPTMDYMQRLWTTAEMSAMLQNPHVTYNTFVQVTKLNHNTIAFALLGGYDGSLDSYFHFLNDMKDNPSRYNHLKRQEGIHILLYNIGYMVLYNRYGTNVPMFLASFFSAEVKDKRHNMHAPTLSEAEQEKLIAEYWPNGPDAEPLGKKHPDVKNLLDAIGTQQTMTRDFSHYEHYKGILLLASEVFYQEMRTKKFNQKCFETVLRSLGEHPTKPKFQPDEPYALGFTMPGDDQVVRAMILDQQGAVAAPAFVEGVKFPDVPSGHELHVQLPSPAPTFMETVEKLLHLETVDYETNPEKCPRNIMLSAHHTNGDVHCSVDVSGSHARVVVSGSESYVNVVFWANASNLTADRTMGKHTLKPKQVFLIVSCGTVNATFMASGVTHATVTEASKRMARYVKENKKTVEDDLCKQLKIAGIKLDQKIG